MSPVTCHPSRILIVAPSWIGDTIIAQPLFMRLVERNPGCRIDVLAQPWVAPVLRAMPQIAEVIESPLRHGRFDLRLRWQLARRLAAGRYDEAIVLPNSWKSALMPFLAGIGVRTGFVGESRHGLLNRLHRLDIIKLPRQVDRYAQLAQTPGEALRLPLQQPRLTRDPARETATLAALGLALAREPVVFCPGAEYGPAKRWPADYYAELARALAARNHAIWLLGSAADAPVAEQIVAGSGGAAQSLCGRTSLAQALDLIGTARLVVTNDSGLMHVAAALGTPLVALYGSSSPDYTPPLSDKAAIIWRKPDCSPCFERVCPLGHFRCMRELTPDSVLQTATARLADA
ncbi:MAG: lipopolysaccharide heptosyltransferase II [Sterolibacteriaceae bacterium]|nr:lipopolysaccharide heptosyltransferase II [Sterolibacteriaceae bacterium]MBK9085889.1 lipopolysaccharide heptosyltransferase II [Sterolibacteriaceae bacterium]